MMFVHVPKHKLATATDIVFRVDGHIIRQTADHVDGCFKAACCGMKYDVIAPCTTCRHGLQVIIPRPISVDKVEQFCPIQLQHERTIMRLKEIPFGSDS